jgi:hypothetical protein
MTIGLDHPAVNGYLARLTAVAVASGLPAGRREELLAEIRGHIGDALNASSEPTDVAVAEVLDRLGPVEDIVAAERHDQAGPPAPAQQVPTPRWGGLEIIAVVALAAGSYLLPVVGTMVGLVCAWMSPRWTTRQKSIATALSVLPLVVIVAGGVALFAGSSVSSTVPAHVAPVVVSPAPEVTP